LPLRALFEQYPTSNFLPCRESNGHTLEGVHLLVWMTDKCGWVLFLIRLTTAANSYVHTWIGAGRVRFANIDEKSPDHIPSWASLPAHLDITFGLLPAGGVYETDLCSVPSDPPTVQLTDPKLTVIHTPCGDTTLLALQFTADAAGPFASSFQLLEQGREVTVTVTATVIPRHKGTPRQRPHVRFLGGAVADTDID
jgi:hypothetical protein